MKLLYRLYLALSLNQRQTHSSKFFKQARVLVIEGADHFFGGADAEMINYIAEFMSGS